MSNSRFTDPDLPMAKWPKRQVVMTFTHETAGDAYFTGMIDAATKELRAAETEHDGQHTDFTASNGVQIAIRTPPMDYDV